MLKLIESFLQISLKDKSDMNYKKYHISLACLVRQRHKCFMYNAEIQYAGLNCKKKAMHI